MRTACDPSLHLAENERHHLAQMIDAIGEPGFETRLLLFLHGLCGAEHCAIYQLKANQPARIGAASLDGSELARERTERYIGQDLWRRDPMLPLLMTAATADSPSASGGASSLVHMAVRSIRDVEFRNTLYPKISDRVYLAGTARDRRFSLSVLRTDSSGTFREGEVDALRECAQWIVPMIAKHAGNLPGMLTEPRLFDPVPTVEARLRQSLPQREAQVCARVLRGLSSTGIALDLDIGVESVKTYRKRAYQRLRIGSERELINWYLDSTHYHLN